MNASPFAKTESEAEKRYEKYESLDPFPDIQPALLNSAEIYDYVAATGMIYPFYPNELESATYPFKLLGRCVYWTDDKKTTLEVSKGDAFHLEKDSIAFLTLEPMIRLPDYIARDPGIPRAR